jgi:hypothetical protein
MRKKLYTTTKIKLARRLLNLGITVKPKDLWCAEDFGPVPRWDKALQASWGCSNAEYKGQKMLLTSDDSMTKCIRNGMVISKHFGNLFLEVAATMAEARK